MAHGVPNPPPGFDGLGPEEQIEYVQALWDRIAAGPNRVGVPDWHERVVRERLAAYRADPAAGRDWDRVRTDLRAQLDKAPGP
jgi:putative addiction module component (TIGR02574 family)